MGADYNEKETVKEKRLREQKAKKEQYKNQQLQREEREKREREEKEKEEEIKVIRGKISEDTHHKKSKAKAAGLKSVFVLDEKRLLMTSFGNGNEAICEKYVENGKIKNISNPPSLNVVPKEKKFLVSGRIVTDGEVNDPFQSCSKRKPGQDLIFCKDNLERIYFGKTFADNIHIQLIYNILDIEKILAVQVNNIVYQLNNILRMEEEEHGDLIGYLGNGQKYEKLSADSNNPTFALFQRLINQPQMGYFGQEFIPYDKKGRLLKENDYDQFVQKSYYLLSVLGMVRQATAHGAKKTRASVFNLGKELSSGTSQSARYYMKKALDDLYRNRVHELNEGFLDKSKKDIYILIEILGMNHSPEEKKKITQEYYKFIVLKEYKSMGFSIKNLRETIAEEYAPELLEKNYDRVRYKLNRIIDFLIYSHYQKKENKKRGENLVNNLRSSMDKANKQYFYQKEAKYLWDILKDTIENNVLPKMNGEYIKNIHVNEDDFKGIEEVFIKETADPFSEIIYLLTIFLDGKEINDLLTQLINKFENIASFYEVIKKEKLPEKFNPDYQLFEESKEIAKELRVIHNFARMSQPSPNAEKVMFLEAAEILGYEEDQKEMESYIAGILGEKKDGLDAKKTNGFCNFIFNNVIKSNRFKYLIRYGNPKKIRKLSQNENVVQFVLKGIPDEQIRFYYNSCNDTTRGYFPEMRNDLCKKITGLHFKDFENVHQQKTRDVKLMKDKERKKNIIRLYLTVLYLLQKNLVYVNSRYYLAFHCAERDAIVYDKKKYGDEKKLKEDRSLFAKEFLLDHPYNYRAQKYLELNFTNADPWSINAFRNCTEHLTAVRNADQYINDIKEFHSYFELYHYLVQRCIMAQFEFDCAKDSKKNPGTKVMSREQVKEKLLDYFKLVDKYGTYCKDFVKALNVAFAYNLPRYKNLSINELFDRNNYLPKEGKKIQPEE